MNHKQQANHGFNLRSHFNPLALFKKKVYVNNLPNFYVGKWNFTDDFSGKVHLLEINETLTILIDGRKLPGKITKLDDKELIFIDRYGYQLRLDATEKHPISLFDEADNRVYPIVKIDG
ncbi:DUF4828 domain-containing protein [Liquorilactobacillus cacaonum]|uniref:DUF4828 domain-containing protein n=1 Tax=Liquorilactobacillus cacaonum DSM 21116 TaxID=1423729 RepID=A0A0R2CEP2_9LACO|nr:DUF4828 domain-containing protein [Liquorilactobacillus cacaonum]KRM90177.1 hypothetical protein FC80_GL001514 [Liquorilactobacillus cacaonum DSM 21116]